MRRLFFAFLDDILLLAGCCCILYGLSLWSAVVTWIVAGLMFYGFAFLVVKVKAQNVDQ
jgi:hypothetical protein